MVISVKLVNLDYARKHMIPRSPDGKPVNKSTLYRWIHKGLEGLDDDRIKLAVTYAGSRPCVTAEGINEFFAAVTDAKLERHRRVLELQSDVTDDEMEAAGLL